MAEYHQHQDNEVGRVRDINGPNRTKRMDPIHQTNPFPWMSRPEAIVMTELLHRNVPFSWRYFDGDAGSAPNFMEMLGRAGYYPEFTLRDYKLVIFITGAYFGSLPGVIDKTALAQVLLEADGWKVVVLYEFEILYNLQATFDRDLPMLAHPVITGPERTNPQFGDPSATRGLHHTRVHLKLFTRRKRASRLEAGEHPNERIRHNRFNRTISDGRIRGRGTRRRSRPEPDSQ